MSSRKGRTLAEEQAPIPPIQDFSNRPWRTFAIGACLSLLLVLGIVLRFCPPSGALFQEILAAAVAFPIAALAAVLALVLGHALDIRLPLFKSGFLAAAGPIAAFLAVGFPVYFWMSGTLRASRESAEKANAQKVASLVDRVNTTLLELADEVTPALGQGAPGSKLDHLVPRLARAIEEAVEIGVALDPRNHSLVSYFQAARLLGRREYRNALKTIKELGGQVHGTLANFEFLRAQAYMGVEDWDAALAALAAALKLHPNDAVLCDWAGICHFRRRWFPDAYRAFGAAAQGHQSLVKQKETGLVAAKAILGKMAAFQYGRDGHAKVVGPYERLASEAQVAVGTFDTLAGNWTREQGQKRRLGRAAAYIHHLAGNIATDHATRIAHYDQAICRLGDLAKEDLEARKHLGLALLDRGKAHTAQKNVAAASADSFKSTEILFGLRDTRWGQDDEGRRVICEALVIAGNHALAGGGTLPQRAAAAEEYLSRAASVLGDAPRLGEDFAVLRGTASAYRACGRSFVGRVADAHDLARRAETDLRPYAHRGDVKGLLAITLKILKSTLPAGPAAERKV